MRKLSLCINSQTPLIKFKHDESELQKKYRRLPSPIPLTTLSEGDDYEFTPGGVTRMVYPLLKSMLGSGDIARPYWVCLNPCSPAAVDVDGITMHHIGVKQERMRGYSKTKETIWKAVHGLEEGDPDLLWQPEYSDFQYYNRMCSERMLSLEATHDFDLFYVHDFQQLTTGSMLPPLKPKVFRWHIPFDESSIPFGWRAFLMKYLNSYDSVIVSCARYLETLSRFGYKGAMHHIYPYIDQRTYGAPRSATVDAFCARHGLADDDRVIAVVARLDPMKGQDTAVRAFAKVVKKVPNAKLMLIGNGSFSSSKRGVGLTKAARWKGVLTELVQKYGIADRVVFAGHVNHAGLQSAYTRAEFTVLPSVKEGFGLVAIESWLYKKPVVVSTEAGISELITDGENGLLFPPRDAAALAEKMLFLLNNPDAADELAERGFVTSKKCYIDRGVEAEKAILRELVD